jgi:hypothetical protein
MPQMNLQGGVFTNEKYYKELGDCLKRLIPGVDSLNFGLNVVKTFRCVLFS